MNNLDIRLANPATDLPAIARLISPYEANLVTVDQVCAWFAYNPPERISQRLAAVNENDIVRGYGVVVHEGSAPTRRFYVWLGIEPALRGRGIGSALWEAALAFLREHGATRVKSEVQDHDPASQAFAERRGLVVERHSFGSWLDIAAFDETPHLPAIRTLAAQGIRFCALADFPDTPETRHKLYDLNTANDLDVPGAENDTPTFSHCEEFVIRAPWFCREGQLLAVDGDTWVGLCAVGLTPEAHSAYNAHTGVLCTYRGRKIAQSLKIMAIRYARQHGAQITRTHNDSLNAPILAINRRLSYQSEPSKYSLVLSL